MNIENKKNLIELIAKSITLFVGVSFALGFLIWNIYLQRLGFFSDDLLQVRYVLTGVSFATISLFIFFSIPSFGNFIIAKLKSTNEKNMKWLLISTTIFVVWVFIFSFIIFPFMPQWLGGGSPRVVSLVTTTQEINYLNKFGIKNGLGSFVQSENICIAYEDKVSIVAILPDRVMSLKKEFIKGFGSLPTLDTTRAKFQCSVAIVVKSTGLQRAIQ